MGAARFAGATQARTDRNLGEALSAERVRHVKQMNDLKARWATEVAALQSQLRTARTEHAQQMQALVENHVIEATTLQRQLSVAREEVGKLRAVNAHQASELKSLEGVKGFIEQVRGVQ